MENTGQPKRDDLMEELLMMAEEFRFKIPFINKSKNENPSFNKLGDSGFDVRASLEESIVLKPLERALIPTGLYFDLPNNLEIQVRPRSGLAINHGITVLNTPGTVDANYTGEIKVILINLSNEQFKVNNGDRIAQLVINSVPYDKAMVEFEQVDEIMKETERNKKGFGSTGVE